ncbi:MAG: hypothetical protein HUU32_06205 [Calditrichaceae bacterium]|nr:DUF6132 family protein [Calditrichia bacterium]NUQ40970.1 hypothetical protein [Calditrichaceae bacterium]
MNLKQNRKKILFKPALFGLAGALLGFGYYYFIGCNTGTCPITSSPYISTAYGAVMGVLLGAGGKSGAEKKPE